MLPTVMALTVLYDDITQLQITSNIVYEDTAHCKTDLIIYRTGNPRSD